MSDNSMSTSEQWDSLKDHMLSAPLMVGDIVNMQLARVHATLLEEDDFLKVLEDKFTAGSAEHNGAWLNMNPQDLLAEAIAEIVDAYVYCMMFAEVMNRAEETPEA